MGTESGRTVDDTTQLQALLIGINQWQNSSLIPSLKGCHNDVELIRQALISRFGSDAVNATVLLDTEATHAGIKEAIREHLIEPARERSAAGKSLPAFLLHFSGHGSRAADMSGTKASGFDETIVPYDSRQSQVFDIKDWELGELVDELAEFSDNITVVLDCCHSGSGTRDTDLVPRQCPADTRPQPIRDTAHRTVHGATRSVDESDTHVLLSACLAHEVAHEYVDPETQTPYGSFSFAVASELARQTGTGSASYADLHRRIMRRISGQGSHQHPQCEGQRNRVVFGGLKAARAGRFSVTAVSGHHITINAGRVHGVSAGDEFLVLAASDRPSATPARLKAVNIRAAESECEIAAGEAETIPIDAEVEPGALQSTHRLRRVQLTGDPPDEQSLAALKQRFTNADVSAWVKLIDSSLDVRDSGDDVQQDGPSCDYNLSFHAGQFTIARSDGRMWRSQLDAADLDSVALAVRHAAVYDQSLQITNSAPGSTLQDSIQVALCTARTERGSARPGERARDRIVADPLEFETPVPVLTEGDGICLRITNRSDQTVHVAVLAFGYDGSVQPFHPRPGESLTLEPLASFNTPPVRIGFDPADGQMLEADEAFKVFVTESYVELEALYLDRSGSNSATRFAPRNPLESLLKQASTGSSHRLIQPYDEPVERVEDWATVEIPYQLVRQVDGRSCWLRAGATTRVPGSELRIECPTGFSGRLRVPPSAATRAADVAPPALWGLSDQVAAVSLSATRAATGSPTVWELDCDPADRSKIAPETPLTVELPPDLQSESVFALVNSDGVWGMAGASDAATGRLHIDWLPALDTGDDGQQDISIAADQQRAIGRTLKLYLYKRLGWTTPTLGLRKAEYVSTAQLAEKPAVVGERISRVESGEVRHRGLAASELQPGQRVLLIVHGFQSDSTWMVEQTAQLLENSEADYDHILTYDYESLATSLDEAGSQLADALRSAGFAGSDKLRLDVLAHSMGGLVVRAMIELHGGDKFVDRALLAGVPSGGTPVADAVTLVRWLGLLLLNQAGLSAAVIMAGLGLEKVTRDAIGPRQMRVKSPFLKRLHQPQKRVRTHYTLLAGRNADPVMGAAQWARVRSFLSLVLDRALDQVFDDDHDLVVSNSSVFQLRSDIQASVDVHVVDCHHFAFLTESSSRAQLVQWLRQSVASDE